MKNLENKNCLITGAASGIGRSLALGLAKEEMNLFLVDVDMKNLEKVREEIEEFGVKVFIEKCDVSKYEDFKNIAKEVYSKLGNIDLLINNAGISGGGFVETLDLEDWKKVLDVNLWSIIYSIKVFLPKMLERGAGHIVNTGSGAGIIGLPFHPHYIASKFAVVGITEALYSELHNRGLKFSVICPTKIKTNIFNNSDIKLPPNLNLIKDQQEFDGRLKIFKQVFWEEYFKGSLTPDKATKRYIKKIKKNRLYIFDKRIVPIAMFVKGISKRLYKKILRKVNKDDLYAIKKALLESGLSRKENA